MACSFSKRFFGFPVKHRRLSPGFYVISGLCFCSSFANGQKIQRPCFYRKTFSHIFQDCTHGVALEPGRQAHSRMTVSGFMPTVFVFNCLMQMYVKCSVLECARKVFDQMPERDRVSWNKMIYGYSNSGKVEQAQWYFDLMPEKDVVSWNSLISGYVQNRDFLKSLHIFISMGKEGIRYDETTFAIVLKVCSSLENYILGIQLHGIVTKTGFEIDLVASSALLDMYAKCNSLDESIRFFDAMPVKNWVSWSAMIAGCVQKDDPFRGLKFFKEMQRDGIGVSQSTYASVFRSAAGLSALRLGRQLHGHALKRDFLTDAIVGTAVLDMYSKCDDLTSARKVFNSLTDLDLQSYNALITGCSRAGLGSEGVDLFRLLLRSEFGFDGVSLSGAFSSCSVMKGRFEGSQLHGLVIKTPFRHDVCVANATLDMYGKCGMLREARRVFDEMQQRDAVSWNAVIAACEQNEDGETMTALFLSMLRFGFDPDAFTYGSVLKACAGCRVPNRGREIHGRVIKSGMGSDSFVGGVLVDMYCKSGCVGEAEKLHRLMKEPSLVSWNAIISGFSSNEDSEGAQNFFSRMLETGARPDAFTYAAILDTCSNVANSGLGRQIHGQIVKGELHSDPYIVSTLVDMYSKCGDMDDAVLVFDRSSKRDFVAWNAMICAYAHHGRGMEALRVFETMQLRKVTPNRTTFLSVLRACAHVGRADEASRYFDLMRTGYGIEPELEHYSSMVDALGKCGRLADALNLIREMPFEADDVMWRTLLSVCKANGNVEAAESAANSLLEMDPNDPSAYVLLSNVYADAGMWGEVAKIRRTMRDWGMKKEPGCSWIEVQSEVHMFLAGDRAHPKCREIYENLKLLIWEIRRIQ
ncbi:hypothetical protein M569_11659 [Genlisea aurea]|uniref:Pentatricopeptide repeat-containing protein n=1 Tax=Genlisea aurea TaxID=192259 RepID=S8DTH8_9LAMI|nr:hypothetical protein M569_11659 [Genlisea aurea]